MPKHTLDENFVERAPEVWKFTATACAKRWNYIVFPRLPPMFIATVDGCRQTAMTHSRCDRRSPRGRGCAVAVLLLLLVGCASFSDGTGPGQTAPLADSDAVAIGALKAQSGASGSSSAATSTAAGSDVALTALALIGVPYVFASDDPARGLDCSGLVRHAFRASLSLELPRSSEQMAARGVPISAAELLVGDLVFFHTLGRRHSHVGIYIGDRQFVHAPTANGAVRIDLMDAPYWRSRFDGARRVLAPAATAGPATVAP